MWESFTMHNPYVYAGSLVLYIMIFFVSCAVYLHNIRKRPPLELDAASALEYQINVSLSVMVSAFFAFIVTVLGFYISMHAAVPALVLAAIYCCVYVLAGGNPTECTH